MASGSNANLRCLRLPVKRAIFDSDEYSDCSGGQFAVCSSARLFLREGSSIRITYGTIRYHALSQAPPCTASRQAVRAGPARVTYTFGSISRNGGVKALEMNQTACSNIDFLGNRPIGRGSALKRLFARFSDL